MTGQTLAAESFVACAVFTEHIGTYIVDVPAELVGILFIDNKRTAVEFLTDLPETPFLECGDIVGVAAVDDVCLSRGLEIDKT